MPTALLILVIFHIFAQGWPQTIIFPPMASLMVGITSCTTTLGLFAQVVCPSWPRTKVLLIFTSLVAGTIGMTFFF
jgi:hypothetical protein